MKTLIKRVLIAALMATSGATHAESLRPESLPAEAKWVIHLDLEALTKSRIGTQIMDGMVMSQAEKVKKAAKLDLPAILKATHSLTAYGVSYDSDEEGKGVLLWRGEPEIEQIATAFLIQQVEATKAGEGDVTRIQEKPFAIYSMEDKVRAAVIPGEGLILGRFVEEIREAAKVLKGTSTRPSNTESFAGYPALGNGYFFTAHADSLGQNAEIPPQAEVLKLTDGGRFAIGEAGDQLQLQLILRARDLEVTQQIQQVIQGLLALATLSLGEEPELQSIVRATKVNVTGRLVKVDLAVPLEKALEQVEKKKVENDRSE